MHYIVKYVRSLFTEHLDGKWAMKVCFMKVCFIETGDHLHLSED